MLRADGRRSARDRGDLDRGRGRQPRLRAAPRDPHGDARAQRPRLDQCGEDHVAARLADRRPPRRDVSPHDHDGPGRRPRRERHAERQRRPERLAARFDLGPGRRQLHAERRRARDRPVARHDRRNLGRRRQRDDHGAVDHDRHDPRGRQRLLQRRGDRHADVDRPRHRRQHLCPDQRPLVVVRGPHHGGELRADLHDHRRSLSARRFRRPALHASPSTSQAPPP